jgi:GNAT superfamily N-acetyltransferase
VSVPSAVDVSRPKAAAQVLGRAFTTDPVFGWLMDGRPGLQRRLTAVFGGFAGAAHRLPEGRVLVDDERRGAAVWRPPGQWRAPARDLLRNAPMMVSAFGPRLPRALSLLTKVEAAHPRERHWYLEAIGCVPEARGQGVGGTLLAPVLERCDAEGLPAYLESSNPRNISFYERHGFVTMPLFRLPEGCPVITPMWRDPR